MDAAVELTNGETVTIPVNTDQKRLRFPITINYPAETRDTSFAAKTFNVTASGVVLPLSPTDLDFGDVRLACSEGFYAMSGYCVPTHLYGHAGTRSRCVLFIRGPMAARQHDEHIARVALAAT